MPEYKLIYFDFRALAEPIRWFFAIAGVPFEDERIKLEDWAKFKPAVGWGKLPVLVVDGQELTQATAIERYLAKKFNLIPEDDFEAAKADEIVCAIDDIVNAWRGYVIERDAEKKVEIKKKLDEGFVPQFLKRINDRVDSNGNGYIAGGKLSWADIIVACYMDIWGGTFIENVEESYPALKKLMDTVIAVPQITEWISKRPVTAL